MSSSSASSVRPIKYEVFLSFRGPDTRSNFTSHLYGTLRRFGIPTFIDDRLERGEEIEPAILRAIEDSRISVIIFSKDYASSSYCLDELLKIFECKDKYGQKVITVFYHIDPADVDNQTGSFGESIAKHKQKQDLKVLTDSRVRNWRIALTRAASISGEVLNGSSSRCDYLDICGEPEFMERMEMKFHENAMETGSLVVSACGFDSVPAELGWMFNSRQWVSPAVPNQIEAYLSLESEKRIVGNFGTYESAILGVSNAEKLQELRRSRPKRAKPVIPGPFPPKGRLIEHSKEIRLWAVKLPSADSIVVRRTLATLTENPQGLPGVNESAEHIKKREAFWSMMKPAHFGVKLASKTLSGVIRFITVGVFMGLLGGNAIGRWLLFKFPSFFSLGWFRKKGPSEDEVRSATFKMWFVGRGFSDGNQVSQANMKPDMEIVTRLMGPEIGYLTTPIILVQCALILLSERDNLPKGGVFPPGIVFGPTDLQERLQQKGISFDVISKKALPA